MLIISEFYLNHLTYYMFEKFCCFCLIIPVLHWSITLSCKSDKGSRTPHREKLQLAVLLSSSSRTHPATYRPYIKIFPPNFWVKFPRNRGSCLNQFNLQELKTDGYQSSLCYPLFPLFSFLTTLECRNHCRRRACEVEQSLHSCRRYPRYANSNCMNSFSLG